MGMDKTLTAKLDRLRDEIAHYESAIVALSGGIDSSLVAFVAGQILGDRALAVTSGSASLKRRDLELTRKLTADWGLGHEVIVTDELNKASYRANPVNRCFHCKTSLYVALRQLANERGFATILNGTNVDDLGDHRPGLIAADDYEVKSPLIAAGITKAEVRALARALGLENAEKPQAACLSSRFPYGTHIDQALLAQVEAAEEVLAQIGFSQFRVRHHDDLARLEVLPEEFPLAVANHDRLVEGLRALGYATVTLDLKGFRSGSLNEGLAQIPVVNLHIP
jgi:uncharacterized protein